MIEKLKVYSRNIHFFFSLLGLVNNDGRCPHFYLFNLRKDESLRKMADQLDKSESSKG